MKKMLELQSKPMIEKRYTGNIFSRPISKALGLRPSLEYVVPDVLDHRIPQSNGISVHLEGSKSNLIVTCETPHGAFPFSTVVPEATVFSINTSRITRNFGYQSIPYERKILIPPNPLIQKLFPVFSLLHEGGHIWRKDDEKWDKRNLQAQELLKFQLILRAIGNTLKLPKNPQEKARHLEAWGVLGEEERRASAIAVYTIGRLRAVGIDPLPQCPIPETLTEVINLTLKSHEQFIGPLGFTKDEVAGFLAGNLPIQTLQEKVASYLNQTLPTITK